MDELAFSVHNSLIKWKMFKEEEEAKTWKKGMEAKGWRMGDIGHKGDMFYVAYSKVGHYSTKSIEEAGKYYNLRVTLTAGYQCGDSWATTH